MREVHYPFRASLFGLLSGQLSLNGREVKVWDCVPSEEENPYACFLLQQTTLDVGASSRNCKAYRTLIQIEIVTSYYGQQGGKRDCDVLADQVYQKLPDWVAPDVEGCDWSVLQVVTDFDRGQQIDRVKAVNSRLIEIEVFFMVTNT